MSDTNPLFVQSTLQYGAPNFPSIKIEHFEPAIREGILIQLKEVEEIASSVEAPTFANTIEAFENTGSLLTRAYQIFNNLASSDSNDEIQALEDVFSPLIARHHDDVYMNPKLFDRVRAIYDARHTANATPEQLRLIEYYYTEFVKSGALLTDDQKQQLRNINEQLSQLTNKFLQNLLKVDDESGVVVIDVKRLEGLSEDDITSAAEAAKAKGLPDGQYFLTIVNTTRQPLTVTLKDRELRKELYTVSANRALEGEYDNRQIVKDIVTLRAQKAKLFGYDNWASFHLTEDMAKTPENALKMLHSMIPSVMQNVQNEEKAIAQAMSKDMGIPLEQVVVEPWDWEYYGEHVRKEQYDLDESIVREYFEFESVLTKGMFFVMNKLYGITFKPRDDIPTYHADVKAYEIFDENGQSISIFYADYFKRKGKSGGAWYTPYCEQYGNNNHVGVNVMNIIKASGDNKTLLPYDHVSTMMHEFGHYMHGTSRVHYQSLSGTNVSRDFVEFPSTFHEDFAHHPEVLKSYAYHYKTGEAMPEELIQKVIKSRSFNQGYDTYEYLMAALLDLEWHTLSAEDIAQIFADDSDGRAIQRFERSVMDKYGAYTHAIAPRYLTQFFAHTMGGGYSASYYAYMWSEILAADAFEHVINNGGLTRENGEKFRQEILIRGNTRDLMANYVAFKGSEPTTDALLRRRGLAVVKHQDNDN